MSVGLEHYLVLSAILFCIGLYGVLTKRNAVIILMCVELMLNAVNITLIAFSSYVVPLLLTGQVFAIFVMVVAAAEVAIRGILRGRQPGQTVLDGLVDLGVGGRPGRRLQGQREQQYRERQRDAPGSLCSD